MRKILKLVVIGGLGLLVLLAAAAAALAINGNRKAKKQYAVTPAPVAISDDAATMARGEYLASVSCAGCHGDNLGGTEMFSEPGLATIPAPNLTAGDGGIGGRYSDTDYVRAIRHGIDDEGKALAIMPARAYWHYNDEDLGAIIAYLKSVPPVDNDPGQREFGLIGKILVGAGMLDVFSAEVIDHDGPRPGNVAAATAKGEYLVNTGDCRQCHGADLTGGHSGEPGAPPGPNLASVQGWTQDEFVSLMRSGVTPDGRQLDPAYMPWKEYGRMSDDDLIALYEYLQRGPMTAGGSAVSETE